jgi:hypothetical protein
MKTTSIALSLFIIPAALSAQVSGQASGSTVAKTNGASVSSSASAQATDGFRAPSGFSAEGAAKLNAMYAEAKSHQVPREPMAQRVAEGRAKGASEAAIIASTGRVKTRLEASQDAMRSAGRTHPTDAETARGASAMERGVTKAQLQTIAKSSNGDRSLVVAFDVLATLADRGVPVGQAVAQVQANVTSGASDAALAALVNGNGSGTGTGTGNANGGNNSPNAGANVAGQTTATTKPLTGGVTTTVGGVLKKP